MTYEEIVAGFRALEASDFDLMNVNAQGRERLYELTDAVMTLPSPEETITELFAVMERLPESDLGSPGPLVHTLEKFSGYQAELVKSIRRRPTVLAVWMVNRILNTDLASDVRDDLMGLLREAEVHPEARGEVRQQARHFINLQIGKSKF
jgi:hypothetical protein